MINFIFRYVAIGALSAVCGFSNTFVNGNFEAGNANGWTIGGGYRGGTLNPLNVSDYLPGGSKYDAGIAGSHSSIVSPGLDPNTSNMLNQVYSGNYSWRVEDQTSGGYASVISQTVNNYTDSSIFFAWAAVLEGAHGPDEAATFQIDLRDLTAGDDLLSLQYNAATSGGGVDSRFNYDASTNYYWTKWQVEQLALPASRIGHDFRLTVLAADCSPTGHTGYAYLDGFGAVAPPPVSGIPEPATLSLIGGGLLLAGLFRARRRSN